LSELPPVDVYRELVLFENAPSELSAISAGPPRDVEGFRLEISIMVTDNWQFDEAELRRIAESIVVIPGAATVTTVWTDQPIG